MAKATADLVATLGRIRWLMIAVALAALGLSAGLLFATVGRGMRPLDRLAGTIGGLRPDDLSSRIDLGPLPGELVPVVDQMNSLLARIEAAVQREKAFTADVAHELRTPLAGLRSTLEVSLSRERDSQAYRADLSECLKINGQMQAMVDNLLSLARLESGAVSVQSEPVCLASLLAECFKPFEQLTRRKSVAVSWPSSPLPPIAGDRDRLRQVFTNLLDNAVTYVEPGGRIVIDVDASAAGTRITISNTGSNLSAEDTDKVFDRFWRGDAARHQTGIHCGLGLPLAQRLVERLGGTLTAASENGGVFRITLTLGPSPARTDEG